MKDINELFTKKVDEKGTDGKLKGIDSSFKL